MAKSNKQAEITFKANTSQFTQAIKEMNSTMSTLDKELSLLNTQMKGSGESVELLQKKHDLLSQKLEASGTKVENLKSKLDEAKNVFGENSEEVQKCTNQLLTAENQYARLENQISQVDDRMGQLNQQAREESSALGQLENTISQQENALEQLKRQYQNVALEQGQSSDESQKLAREIKDLSGELNENKSRLKEVADSADDLSNSFDDAEDGVGGLGGVLEGLRGSFDMNIASSVALGEAIADLAKNAISFAIDKIKEFGEYLWELPEATEEVRNSLARVEASAKSNGKTVQGSIELYDKLNKYYMDDNASSNCVSNILSIKASQEDLKETVEGMLGVWAEYGDGIDKESLAEDIALTVKMGEVQGALAQVVERTGGNVEEFQKGLAGCKTEEEKLAFVNDYLNGKLGETKKQFDETNGAQIAYNDSQNELKKTQARLAEAILPVQTGFNNLKNTILLALTPAIEWLSEKIQGLIDWFNGLSPQTQEIITTIGIVTGVVLILVGVLGTIAVSIGAVSAVLGFFGITLATVGATILPIIGIILAVIAVITLVVLAIKNWGNICDWLTEKWNQFKEWIGNLWNTIKTNVSNAVNGVKTVIISTWTKIKAVTSVVWNAVVGVITTVWNSIKTKVQTAINKVKSVITTVWNGIKSVTSSIWNGIKSTISTVWNGIKSTIQSAINRVKSIAQTGFNLVKTYIINPIKTAYSTVKTVFSNIYSTIKSKINSAKQAVSNALGKIKSALTSFKPSWSIPKPKLPKVTVGVGHKQVGKLNIPYPTFNVDWNAKGGIFTQPTIFATPNAGLQGVGEAGAEAILPLDGFYRHLDEKLDRIVTHETIDYDMMTNSFITALENLTVSMSAKEVGRLTSKYTEQDINSRTKRLNRLGGATDIE